MKNKVIKSFVCGQVILGACSVKLILRFDGTYEIKVSQGTSGYFYKVTEENKDAEFLLVCKEGLRK